LVRSIAKAEAGKSESEKILEEIQKLKAELEAQKAEAEQKEKTQNAISQAIAQQPPAEAPVINITLAQPTAPVQETQSEPPLELRNETKSVPITGIDGTPVVVEEKAPPPTDTEDDEQDDNEEQSAKDKKKKIMLYAGIGVGVLILSVIVFKLFKRKK